MTTAISTGSSAQYSAQHSSAAGPTVNPLNGQVQWAFRFDLPHGPNDLTPDVQLLWEARSPNGPFGLGFQASVPSVRHRPDGGFELSGRGLLIETGIAEWRLRFDPCALRAERVADGWRVTEAGGRILVFGSAPELRQPAGAAGDQVEAWHLATVEDALGSNITYRYARLDDHMVPDRIEYGPHALVFAYETRPDAVPTASGGTLRLLAHRCREVVLERRIEGAAVSLRRWRLAYRPARLTGQSLLTAISLEGLAADGVTSAWPEVRLEYEGAQAEKPSVTRVALTGSSPAPPSQARAGVVNWWARGRPSLFEVRNDGCYLWDPELGAAFGAERRVERAPIEFLDEPESTAFADLEGAGRTDLVVLSAATRGRYRLLPGGGFGDFEAFAAAPAELLATRQAAFVDVDGDGRVDLLVTDPAAGEARAYLRDERGQWSGEIRVARVAAGEVPPLSLSDPDVRLSDLSGDGRPDFVQILEGSLLLWPGVGTGRWSPTSKRIDLDLPAGIGSLFASRVLFADLTGDGGSDLVVVLAGRILVFVNRHDQTFSSPIDLALPGLVDVRDVVVTDLFGEGKPGLLVWDRSEATVQLLYVRPVGNGDVARLRSVDNGLGIETSFEYVPTVALQEEAEAAGRPWSRFLPFPLVVVGRSVASDRVNAVREDLGYGYRDPVYSPRLRALLGFGQVLIEDSAGPGAPARRIRLEHAMPVGTDDIGEDELALAGALLASAVESEEEASWQVRQTSRQAWEVVPFRQGAARRRRLQQAQSQEHDGAGAPVRRLETLFRYDAWDNVAYERQQGVDSAGEAIVLHTHIVMAADPARRFLQKVARVLQLDGTGSLVAHSRLHYDDDAFGQVGRQGLLARIETQVFTDEMVERLLPASIDLASLAYHTIPGESGWWRTERRFRRDRDSLGRVTLTTEDALGAIQTTTYDEDQLHPVETVDASGYRVRTIPDPRCNRPARIEDAAGYVRRYDYDGLGRPRAVWSSTCTHPVQRFACAYDAAGTRIDAETLADDAAGEYSRRAVFHDGLGREVRSELDLGATHVTGRSRRYTLRGLLREETAGGALAPTRFHYDGLGRPTRIERPGGEVEVIAFKGDRVTQDTVHGDATRRLRSLRLDGLRRPVEVTTGEGAETQVLRFWRDTRGQVTRAELPGGREAWWQFDLLGQEIACRNVESGVRVTVRDAEGRVRGIWRQGGGRAESFTYSPNGWVETRRLGEPGRSFAELEYGPPGAGGPDGGRGRPTSVQQEWGRTSNAFSPEGWLTEVRYARKGGRELPLRFRYRPDGQVSEVVYPGGRVLRYEYDRAGRLLRIPGFVRAIAYGADSRIAALTLQNGVHTEITRAADGRRVDRLDIVGPGGAALLDLRYRRDVLGNVTEISSADAWMERHVDYDGLSRAVGEAAGSEAPLAYHFDAAGRVVEISDVGPLRYGEHGLEEIAGERVEMDALGRRIRQGENSYSYSEADHLRAVNDRTGMAIRSYQYGIDDRAVLALDAQGGLVWFMPDPRIVETADGVFGFLYVAGQPVARFALGAPTAANAFFHTDAFGRVVLVTDEQGEVLRRLRYTATARMESDPPDPVDEALDPCFAGMRYAPSLGLYAYGRRFYDPRSAAFLTADPAVAMPLLPMAWTGHGFLGGNPYRYADPSGWFLEGIGDFFRSIGSGIGQFFDRYGKYILAALAVVAVAVLVIASGGTLGLLLGGMLVGGLVGGIAAHQRGGDVLMGVLVGMALGGLGAWGGAAAASGMGLGTSTFWAAVASGAVKGAIMGAAVGAAGGYAGGAGSMEEILAATFRGALAGAVAGAVVGGTEFALRGFAGTSIPETQTMHEAGVDKAWSKVPGLQGSYSNGGAFVERAASEMSMGYLEGVLSTLGDWGLGVLHTVLASEVGAAVTVGALAGTDTLGYGDDLVNFILGRGVKIRFEFEF